MGLDSSIFDVYVFSSLSEIKEDERSKELISVLNHRYVRLGMTTMNNRDEVTGRRVDILIYLDVGMTASTPIWAASRLAPIQIITWGHPVTTGMSSMDYFISSSIYHNHHNHSVLQDSFSEQLVQLDALGFYFHRPILSFQMLSTKEGEGKITVGIIFILILINILISIFILIIILISQIIENQKRIIYLHQGQSLSMLVYKRN